MRDFIDRIEWEDVVFIIIASAAIFLLVLIGRLSTADHTVRYYYLEGTSTCLTISADIDWAEDEHIYLDRNVSYDDAIKMVKNLNEALSK